MFEAVVAFLVLINPFAMFIFLQPVIRRLSMRELRVIIAGASIVAFLIFVLFALLGDVFFQKILQVDFESFRIFGGMVIMYLAFVMIVHRKPSLIDYNDDHSVISSEIAIPMMVGAGTISMSVIIGKNFDRPRAITTIAIVMALTFLFIVGMAFARKSIVRRFEKGFDKNMDMALRLMAFFAGAIGLNMIITGFLNIWR